VEQEPRQAVLYFALKADHNVNIGLKRVGWGLSPKASYTVSVSVDNVQVVRTDAVASTADLLVIRLGQEAAVRMTFERGSVVSFDAGAGVFKYPLTDVQPLLAKLDSCVDTMGFTAPPPPTAAEARAPSPATEVAGDAESTLAQRCDANHDFVIYHGSWDHEPTAKERMRMREYTQEAARCISVWKARCAPLPLFPMGSTNAFCEIQADYARAHLNNRRDFESRNETYRGYNSRADEIDRIFKETTDSFFASVQKPIDDDNERQRQEQGAQDRQAAARREEELIGILRQLGTPKPVTTQCMGGNGTVQCTSY
jgi:hypothetical protein